MASGSGRVELLQVVEHLRVGVDALPLVIFRLVKMRSMTDDALPLHHLDRVERVELRRPHVVNRGARGVVEPVGEAQVLADERDRIAAEILREIERQVCDRGAGGKRAHVARVRAQETVEKR